MASDFLRKAMIDYVIFFIFLGFIIPLGAGEWITSDVDIVAPEYSGNWLTDILNNLGYFTDLMGSSANLQFFTLFIMVPFGLIISLFLIETIRGH